MGDLRLQIHGLGQSRKKKNLIFFPFLRHFGQTILPSAAACCRAPRAASPSSSQAAASLREGKRGKNCCSKVQIFKVRLSDSSLWQLLSSCFLQQPLGQSSCSQCLPSATSSPTRLPPSAVSHQPSPSSSPSIRHRENPEPAGRHTVLVAQK